MQGWVAESELLLQDDPKGNAAAAASAAEDFRKDLREILSIAVQI